MPLGEFLARIKADDVVDPRDDKIAALEASLGREENRHYEERFVWILVVIVLFDALIFRAIQNWAGAIVIGIIELIGIVILADRCKVDTVAPLIDRLTGFVNRAANRGQSPDAD